jgi:hypothetical protein
MKYYVTDKATWHSVRHHAANSHYIDLPNGQILLMAEFGDAARAAKFNHPNIKPLPHPFKQDKLHPTILAALEPIGVKPEHTTMDVSDVVSKIHPLMSIDH